jgi:hypothetical protein
MPEDPEMLIPAVEPFVPVEKACEFLSVDRRLLLEMTRRGIVKGYALGTGTQRKIWVFRLSELANSVIAGGSIKPGSPR